MWAETKNEGTKYDSLIFDCTVQVDMIDEHAIVSLFSHLDLKILLVENYAVGVYECLQNV